MPRRTKSPNTRLAELLDESGLPAKGLARRVVALGRDGGARLGYDHNSVRRWLEGEQPLAPAPRLVAAVLSEALGRRVTPAEAGFGPDDADAALEFALTWTDSISTAATLYRSDTERRRALVGAVFSPGAYPATAARWLTLPGADVPVHRGRARVGRPEIEAIRQMSRAFRDLDNRVGGGRIRSTVVQYLDSNVAPLLRGTYTEEVGRDLFSAAAEMTRMVGWMAYDAEAHGIAQRYLVQALRMARTAGDAALSAEILAAMGHQAVYVGRAGVAVDLARAAQAAAARSGHPALLAECHLIEAHGHAGIGDGRATSASLRAGQKAFGAEPADTPEWLAYFDGAYLSAKIAHCFRALGSDAQTARYAEQSLQMNGDYVRGKAFNLLILASAHARTEPDRAVDIGERALDLVEGLESRRAVSYLRDLRHRLRPHAALPEVAGFGERAAALSSAG